MQTLKGVCHEIFRPLFFHGSNRNRFLLCLDQSELNIRARKYLYCTVGIMKVSEFKISLGFTKVSRHCMRLQGFKNQLSSSKFQWDSVTRKIEHLCQEGAGLL